MTFADSDCGIEGPHRHTGEIVEGYFIEYWCPSLNAWSSDLTSYGSSCMCGPLYRHNKARIQHVMTEIIDILDPADYDVVEWLKREIKERFWCRLMEGEEAYQRKYGTNDTDDSITHASVRDLGENTAKSIVEIFSEGDGSDHSEE